MLGVHREAVLLGVTVVAAEHRLERVLQYAGRVFQAPGDGSICALNTRTAAAQRRRRPTLSGERARDPVRPRTRAGAAPPPCAGEGADST